MVVEEVGYKGKVELGIAGNQRGGTEKFSTIELVGIFEDLLGTLKQIRRLQRTA